MGVDVASFGDFFADMRPVEGQVKTVSKIFEGSPEASPRTKINQNPENKAEPSVQIGIDDSHDTAASGQSIVPKPPPSRRRRNGMDEPIKCLVYKDPFGLTYKKYIFTADGRYLLGGQMIGDVDDYVKLVAIVKKKVPYHFVRPFYISGQLTERFSQKALEVAPSQFIVGAKKDGTDAGEDLDDDAQVCSCHVSNPFQ